jgi:uncharacterized membrane protein
MESKTKLFGHPIHPMLIVIPLGLFIGAIVFDTIFLFVGNPALPIVSFFNISFGILGGLLAAVFGFMDWQAIPLNTRAKRIAGWHGLGNVVVVLMFAVSWWLRSTNVQYTPSTVALVFSYAAIVVGALMAWLGGELVFRLGVGPDSDANLNASNSLSSDQAGASGKAAAGHRAR